MLISLCEIFIKLNLNWNLAVRFRVYHGEEFGEFFRRPFIVFVGANIVRPLVGYTAFVGAGFYSAHYPNI